MATINAYYSTASDAVDYYSNYIQINGAGNGPGNRLMLAAGDVLRLNYQSALAGTARTVTASGFVTANWTSTTDVVMPATVGSTATKTSKSVNAETAITLSMVVSVRDGETGQTTSGTFTATLFVSIGTPPDTYPNEFSLTPVSGAAPGASIGSNVVTITGINGTTNVSISATSGHACSIRKNGSGNVSSTTVVNGDTLQVFLTAPTSGFSRATLYVGGYSTTFEVSVADTTPDGFAIGPVYSNMDLNVLCISNQIVVSGLGIAVTATISGGGAYFKLNDQPTPYTSATVANGTRIKVYMPSPSGYGQSNVCYLTVGSMVRSWAVYSTSFDPQNGNKIYLGKNTPPLGLGEIINFFGGPYDIFPPAKNLGAYLKGGGYVPPINENAGVPTAAPLNLSQLLGSYHSLYLRGQPAPQEIFIDSRWDGGNTITVDGVGWETLGYGNIRNACQYRYTFTKDYGAGGIAILRTATGSPGTYSQYNHYYEIDIPAPPNAAAIEVKYTLTIEIYCVLNGQTLTTTKDFYITIYNSWL